VVMMRPIPTMESTTAQPVRHVAARIGSQGVSHVAHATPDAGHFCQAATAFGVAQPSQAFPKNGLGQNPTYHSRVFAGRSGDFHVPHGGLESRASDIPA